MALLLACLHDRPPEHIEKEDTPPITSQNGPQLTGQDQALADQQGDHPSDHGDQHPLQQLAGTAVAGIELGARGHRRNQALQLSGTQGDQHG